MNERPRIKDVAQRLGVSPATVSRALSDTGLVAEPTLSRIREAARAIADELEEQPGHAVAELVAASDSADLVVVGSRGLHGLKALGSVSERVANQARSSVLVVRPLPAD